MPPLGSYSTVDGKFKLCARCRKWKPLKQFVRCNRVSNGRGSYCKPCHRARDRISVYGIEIEATGECELCGSDQNLRIDHYQPKGKPKKVRGILCHKCNIALGMFDHDIELLQSAILYLEERGS